MALDPNPKTARAPDRTLLKAPGPRECIVDPPFGDLQCIRQPNDQPNKFFEPPPVRPPKP